MTAILSQIKNFAYILEMIAACLIFALPLNKRKHAWLGFLAGSLISLAISVLVGSILQPNIFWAALTYLIQLVVVVLPIWFSCEVSLEDAVYGTLCAYAMQHFASSLYIFLCVGVVKIPIYEIGWIAQKTILFYLCSYVGIYWVMYYLFARPLGSSGKYDADLFKAGGLTILVVPIALFLSLYGKWLGDTGVCFSLCQVYAMLCSAFVLWVQTSQRKEVYWRTELALSEQLWQKQKEQYQLSKDTIEIINRKCHDLKHQVAALKHICNDSQREAYLGEIEKAVMIYDSSIQTGNRVLDTVLSEKSLVCEHKEIKWTCMADGRQLDFVDPVDLYAIFGNAIDNAIESVQDISNPEKRVISINVFHREELIILQIENYYEQNLQFEDGLPVSSKADKTVHGFGMKSIRQTVEKYNGSLSIHTDDHIFILNILLPVQKKEGLFN